MSNNTFPRKSTTLRRLVSATFAAGVAAALLPLATAESAVAAGGTTYYVSPSGNDSASGTSPSHALRTPGRVEGLNLQPGDKVLFQRGATFSGKLGVWRSGTAAKRITIGSYGSQRAPRPRLTNNRNDFCVMVGASYVTVTDVHVTGCRVGIWSRGTENLITRVEATKNMHGIEIDAGSQRTRVLRNHLHHNDLMATNTPGAFDDYGAVGVVVVGDNTEVAFNRIHDNWAPSADFGTDGSAVEIYGGIGTVVHHNVARNNRTFTELGNSRSANTTYAYNVATSTLKDSEFLITRGSKDYFGPVRGTVAVNNTVKLTGSNSRGFLCYAGCTKDLFAMYNNIFDVAGLVGHLEGERAGGNNIYWRGSMWSVTLLPGDRVVDPRFRKNRVGLKSNSPAIDRVRKATMRRDVRGTRVGVDGNGDGKGGTDIGAIEAKHSKRRR